MLLLLLVKSATDLSNVAKNFRQFELKLILLGNDWFYIYTHTSMYFSQVGKMCLKKLDMKISVELNSLMTESAFRLFEYGNEHLDSF